MPADSISAAHSALTEMSAHPSRRAALEKKYTIPRLSERGLIFEFD